MITGYDLLVGPGPVEIFGVNLIIDAILLFVFLFLSKYKFTTKKFFIGLILVYVAGLISDSFILFGYYFSAFSWIFTTICLFVLNFLIGFKYFNLDTKNSLVLGLWMAILTTPITANIIYYPFAVFEYQRSHYCLNPSQDFVSWCNTCKASNWSPEIKMGKKLSDCFYNMQSDIAMYNFTSNTDCTSTNVKEACRMMGIS